MRNRIIKVSAIKNKVALRTIMSSAKAAPIKREIKIQEEKQVNDFQPEPILNLFGTAGPKHGGMIMNYVQYGNNEAMIIQYLENRGLQGIIGDWSGTFIDSLVFAPAIVFIEIFKKYGVDITVKEARTPMGFPKDKHIKAITEIPTVREKWFKAHGRYPKDGDAKEMFDVFEPMQLEVLSDKKYVKPIPGAIEALEQIKEAGFIVGLTSGFNEKMHERIMDTLKDTKLPGLIDVAVPIRKGIRGRPFSDACDENCKLMGLEPKFVLKVDDTKGGIEEGNAAGCVTAALFEDCNYVGMSVTKLGEIERIKATQAIRYKEIMEGAKAHLQEARPDFIVPTFAHIPDIVRKYNDQNY